VWKGSKAKRKGLAEKDAKGRYGPPVSKSLKIPKRSSVIYVENWEDGFALHTWICLLTSRVWKIPIFPANPTKFHSFRLGDVDRKL